ncbi:MAG: hypothetical protein ACYDGW_08180 [Vulcanimicrobiaceae bacterium]
MPDDPIAAAERLLRRPTDGGQAGTVPPPLGSYRPIPSPPYGYEVPSWFSSPTPSGRGAPSLLWLHIQAILWEYELAIKVIVIVGAIVLGFYAACAVGLWLFLKLALNLQP